MPTQVLSRHPGKRCVSRNPSTWLARLLTFGGALLLTVVASRQMYFIIPVDEVTSVSAPWLAALLWLLLILFTITFGWISLSATAAVAGLFCGRDRRLAGQDALLRGKTVLLMPIYNENAPSACAALAAMGEDLASLGLQEHFEIFILSDTNKSDILPTETAAVQCLRQRLLAKVPVWYRRREQNTDRKAGNIRDFISRWGSRYDYMVVLDADSLIAGETLATLVREMDADASTGIL
jgi:membrane glycosyltransferase